MNIIILKQDFTIERRRSNDEAENASSDAQKMPTF